MSTQTNKVPQIVKVGAGVIAAMLLATLAMVVGMVILGVTPANAAPSDMTPAMQKFADAHASRTCTTFATYPSAEGVLGIGEAIMDMGGFDAESAGEIIGYQITNYCPDELPALLKITHPHGGPVTTVSFSQRGGGGRHK